MPALHTHRTKLGLAVASLLLVLPACSVNVKDGKNGENSKVDIQTPVGGIHVSEEADVRDIGLAVYPGARMKTKQGNGNERSANVNISTGFFALRVIVVEYETDDAPEKVISFYRDQLRKYGKLVECHTHKHGGHAEIDHSDKSNSDILTCEEQDGDVLEIKAGTKENQRMASIEPQGKGTSFALLRVQARGNDKDRDTI
jgi:hypothetical protein